MLADFFTKPLQGSLFRKFRALILNTGETITSTGIGSQECVGNGAGVSIRTKHRRVDPTPVVVKDSSASALVG